MNGRAWSAGELETLRINYPKWPNFLIAHVLDRSESSVNMQAGKLGLRKGPEFFRNPHAYKWDSTRHPRCIASRFQPGQVPANKGLRRPGWAPGRMRETQFRKGEVRGRAALVQKPIGTERISKDGYLERKVNNDLPFQARWRAVHLLLWEEHLGPVPPGFAVTFKNGDRTDIRIDNLALVSRRVLMRRNSYHYRYPKDVCRAMQLRGALVRAINRKQRQEPIA